ncbi:hypothetical protein BJ170DRAFT_682618 [Xylariales sp. AK1849]|nr:hypothetical protein BJ170DRAFT_682618 [Xylariales sp. AK1849]
MSTAPSSPRSPTKKQEFMDLHLHSIPSTRSKPSPETFFADVQLPPLRYESAEGTLPRLDSVLMILDAPPASLPDLYSGLEERKYSSTPGRSSSEEYVLPQDRRGYCPGEDSVIDHLNQWRYEKSLKDALIQWRSVQDPRKPLVTPFPHNVQVRTNYALPQSCRRASYDHLQLPHVAMTGSLHHAHGGAIRKKRKNLSHCNKRYTKEQKDFIRYLIVDEKISWNELKKRFENQYPDFDFDREVQGLQGVYYRQNNKELPEVDCESNRLVYMANGHQKLDSAKCRDQQDKKLYGIVNLFPGATLTYPWVGEEHRRQAAERVGPRQREREQAKRLAVENGLWVETLPAEHCACCIDLRHVNS